MSTRTPGHMAIPVASGCAQASVLEGTWAALKSVGLAGSGVGACGDSVLSQVGRPPSTGMEMGGASCLHGD